MIKGEQYDIRELYRSVFGYVAPPFPAGELATPSNPLTSLQAVAGTFKRKRGLFIGQEQFMPLAIDGIKMDIEPLISVRGNKKIVRTAINGGKRKGTVKELFAMDDWQIEIKGFVQAEDGNFPEEELADIREWFETQDTLRVDNQLLRVLGVQYIAIESVDFPEMVGVEDMLAFQMSGYSDDFPENELE